MKKFIALIILIAAITILLNDGCTQTQADPYESLYWAKVQETDSLIRVLGNVNAKFKSINDSLNRTDSLAAFYKTEAQNYRQMLAAADTANAKNIDQILRIVDSVFIFNADSLTARIHRNFEALKKGY